MKNLYIVLQPFRAMAAISGRERHFQVGETFLCDPAQPGEMVIIETDEYLFLADQRAFKACCKWKNEGTLA